MELASALYGIPFFINAILSPFLGYLIDRIGKRAYIVTFAGFVILFAFIFSLLLPQCDKCYNEVLPQIFIGIGISFYAPAMWGSIPFTVESKNIGTAFGLTTAL